MADNEYKTINDLESSKEIGGRSDWGNMLVVNTGRNPVINFAFMLRVEGAFDLPCKAVKGIRRENEFDYIQEGGLNDYVHLKRKAISKPFTFQVERYVGVNWIDPMPLGTELVLPLILFVNNQTFPALKPVRNYVFTGCTVIAKDYGELNAEVSGLLVETVTIAYREMICLDIPNDTLSGDTWKFDGKKREGEGKRHYNSNLYNKEWETNYNSKNKMESRAKKWKLELDKDGHPISVFGKDYSTYATDFNKEIDKQIENAKTPEEKKEAEAKRIAMKGVVQRQYKHSKTAKKYVSAKFNKSEPTQQTMEKEAEKVRWKPTKDKDGHLTPKYGNDYEKYVSDFNAAIDKQIKNATTEEEKKKAEAMKIAIKSKTSRQYIHSKTAKKYSSAKFVKGELSKTDMEKKASLYQIDKTKAGAGKSSAKHIEGELSKTELEAKAKLYKIDKTKAGAGKSSATHIEGELSKTDMEKKASLYQIDKTKAGAGKSSAKHIDGEQAKTAWEAKANLYKHDKTKAGAGTSSAKHIDGEQAKTAWEAKVNLYKHDKTKAGSGTSSAKHIEKELSRQEMEKAHKLWPEVSSAQTETMKTPEARLWPRTRSAKQITDFLKKH